MSQFKSKKELEEFLISNDMYIPFVEKVCSGYMMSVKVNGEFELKCDDLERCTDFGCRLHRLTLRTRKLCNSLEYPCPDFEEYLEEIKEQYPEYRI